MAAMNTAQLAEVIAAVTQAVLGSMSASGAQPAAPAFAAGGAQGGGYISGRHLHLKKFTGELSQWDDWAWAFKNIITSQNATIANGMTGADTAAEEVDEEVELSLDQAQRSAELYSLLCQLLEGEPLTIMRTVGKPHGLKAWQLLYKKYNPRTMAKGIRMLCEVTSPPKVKDLKDFDKLVMAWEARVKKLKDLFREELSDGMRVAIFTNMLPASMQDHIYTSVDKDTSYTTLRDKMRSWVANKVVQGPAPIDVGEVKEVGEESWEDAEIDEVSKTVQCYTYHGFGHVSSACPSKTSKGKAKGKTTKGR